MNKPTKPTKAALRRRVKELEAQLVSTYYFASKGIGEVQYPKLTASGVILELTILGGQKTMPPVMIRDGLSPDTVAAIRADLRRSYEEAVEFKPRGETS